MSTAAPGPGTCVTERERRRQVWRPSYKDFINVFTHFSVGKLGWLRAGTVVSNYYQVDF